MSQIESDRNIYNESLEAMVKNLNEMILPSDTDIVISLSRKGPRLLEYLRIFNGLKEFAFTTEHSLPFIFEKISNSRDKKYRIFIVDDAIYFGSTIQNLYKEILAYIAAYQLDNVEFCAVITAIKASDSKNLEIDEKQLLNYKGSKIRPGYGHYFVKSLMYDFSKLNDTLEVEFPTVEYTLPRGIDDQLVENSIKQQYPDAFKSEQNGESGLKLCIDLGHDKTSCFNKVRIFKAAEKLRFVFMNPHYFNNNEETLAGLMVGQGSPFRELWDEIQLHFKNINSEIRSRFNSEIRRNRLRTQVVLANYIMSFNNYLVEKSKIDVIVRELGGDETSYEIRENNLAYLIGDNLLVANTLGRLRVAVDSHISLDPVLAVKEMTGINDYVLEGNSLPKEELEVLQNHNLVMINNSQNTEEALAAMFNNQTILIEKWTRGTIYDNNYRLRFGYTMKSLTNFIHRYGQFKIAESELFQKELHKWIDVRIDCGCIVPQYIVDSATSTWMRVFRPGENEELLLSHLARLVLCVWNKANEILKVQKVNSYTFQSILSVIINTFNDELREEEPYLHLAIDGKLLPCIGGNNRNIVSYMKDMYILTEDNGFLECSPRLQNKEFKTYTTLSNELEDRVKGKIQELLPDSLVQDNPFADFSAETNYQLRYLLVASDIEEKIKFLKGDVLRVIDSLILNDGSIADLNKEEADALLANYFTFIKPYLFSEERVAELNAENHFLYDIEEQLQKVLALYNVLLLVYNYNDNELLGQYLDNNSILLAIGMEKVVDNIQAIRQSGDIEKFHQDRGLVDLLLEFANTI